MLKITRVSFQPPTPNGWLDNLKTKSIFLYGGSEEPLKEAVVQMPHELKFQVFDPSGVPLKLQHDHRLDSGGEGVVFTFADDERFVLKLCQADTLHNQTKLQNFHQRFQAMLKLRDCVANPAPAWPLMPVLDENGNWIGFAMRRMNGRTLRSLYAPMQTQRFFPQWTRIEVVQVAANFVQRMQELARHNILVNDFNPANLLINASGQVLLIDCDSFQPPGHTSGVYSPEYAAPELLHDRQLFCRERTIEQTRFSITLTAFMIVIDSAIK